MDFDGHGCSSFGPRRHNYMRTTWNFHTAGKLIFGAGAAATIGEQLARRNWKRALLVTDPRLIEAGIIGPIEKCLRDEGITFEIFADSEPEPAIETARVAIAKARDFGPEAIVGIGGGSNMDLAKIVAVAATFGGEPADYFGFDRVPGPTLPIACVATTAGTGSEVSHAAVLTDKAAEMKLSTLSNYLRPALAIVDPLLTHSCPRQVTADSGIDALTHAIEAYLAIDYRRLDVGSSREIAYEGSFPLGDCLAEKAIGLIGEHLRMAVAEPDNAAAREGMALAATLAGMAFSNAGVGLVHALEYPLGGTLHCSHGGGNGMLLPFVMQFNRDASAERLATIARLLGEPVNGLSTEQAAERAIGAVVQLRREIGIPLSIRDLGGSEDQLPGFAAKSFAIKRLMAMNPRQVSFPEPWQRSRLFRISSLCWRCSS